MTETMQEKDVATITVFGASDDLIEVESSGLSAEFSCYGTEETPAILAFSDGTVLSAVYGADGAYWRLNRLIAGAAEYEKREATSEDRDYSDIVTLRGKVEWVLFGSELVRSPAGASR